ncbi:MAG: transposase [Bdellovibrionaceae bacterium]|nr:transposase [Pseudobdellovibrionaceae bacterium]MBX3033323.1 transposase [Pseudobdellovibrionaceae bacterium]
MTWGLFAPLSVSAQSVKAPAPTGTSSRKNPGLASPHHLSGQLRFESMQYLSTVPESPDLTRSQLLSVRAQLQGPVAGSEWLAYGGDFAAGTFFKRGLNQFVVHELFLNAGFGSDTSLSAGRKKASWSEMDERWQLGLWQPHFAMDSLRPESQGLTGVFLEHRHGRFEILGFATPIFIPTMGPEIREENGSLVSDSRWYRQPSSRYDFNNRINSLVYRLDVPEAEKLVGNPGSALRVRWGDRDRGPRVAAAWGYKPVNELLLKRANFKVVDQDRFDVTVSPDVTYHELVSADLGYATERVDVSLSHLADLPREKRPAADWVVQRIDPLSATSFQMDIRPPRILSRQVLLQLGYLKVQGGGITDITAEGWSDDFNMFDQRVKFTDVLSIGLQTEITRFKGRPLTVQWRSLYDRAQKGSLFSAEFTYSPAKEWALMAGADVLGVEDDSFRPSGFLNQFRANDRVYGGMTYVF